MAAVRVVAWVRVAVAIGVGATGSFLRDTPPSTDRLYVALSLVWVPWACVVLFASDRPHGALARYGGPAGDVVALFAIQAVLPRGENAALLGYLLVVAFTAYTSGRGVAGPLGAGVLVLALAGHTLAPDDGRAATSALLAFSAALTGLVVLLDRTLTLQLRAAAHTERLQGQADAILARVADAVVVTDAASHVLQWNPAAERLAGRAGADVTGLTCADVLGLHHGEKHFDCARGCALLRLAENEGGSESAALGEEVWRLDLAGRRQPLLANVSAVRDASGRVVEVVHSLRDITRIKQAEEAKTLFLATASHELKTPLTVINGFAETLLNHPLDAQRTSQALESISRRGRELARIVDRLLLSSRIEAGRAEVQLSEVDVRPVVEERVAAVRGATGRMVRYDVTSGVPDVVVANEEAVSTVVDHLLDNAIKYSPSGAPVTVSLRGGPHEAVLDVTDGGIGMDEEQARSCFDKFWQAESTDVRRFGGTGIGLYIVRSLVDAMGGDITVESASGAGTTFRVVLRTAPDLPQQRPVAAGLGEATSIREFMRQIGVPERGAS